MLNSESIVIIWIKGEHLLYSKISGRMIGYGWGNVCYIVNFPPREYLLYSKGKFAMQKVYYTTPETFGNIHDYSTRNASALPVVRTQTSL